MCKAISSLVSLEEQLLEQFTVHRHEVMNKLEAHGMKVASELVKAWAPKQDKNKDKDKDRKGKGDAVNEVAAEEDTPTTDTP